MIINEYKKIQIRKITNSEGMTYKIFDLMVKNEFGVWISIATYDVLEEATRHNHGIIIEDLSIN